MGELHELFKRRNDGRCDKWHHYFDIYERHLAQFRGQAVNYLEIGVQAGGSLLLMRDWLGPAAKISGVDIDPACKRIESEGFSIHIGDQADKGFIQAVAQSTGPLDVVLDDGGHTAQQMIVSFFGLWPHLNPGGVYIVEDMHCAFWTNYQASSFGINFYDLAKGMVDKLSLWNMDPRLLEHYRVPPEKRSQHVVVPNFVTHQVYSIAFYDSVIVFEKRNIAEPWSERR